MTRYTPTFSAVYCQWTGGQLVNTVDTNDREYQSCLLQIIKNVRLHTVAEADSYSWWVQQKDEGSGMHKYQELNVKTGAITTGMKNADSSAPVALCQKRRHTLSFYLALQVVALLM